MNDKVNDYLQKIELAEPFTLGGREVQWQKVNRLKTGTKIAVVEEDNVFYDEIVSIKKIGRQQVWDIEVEGTRNFIGGHLIDRKTENTLSAEEETEYLRKKLDPADVVLGGMVAHNTYISGNLGVGSSSPVNNFEVLGKAVIGSGYAQIATAPTDGLLVQGNVGVGTTNPLYALDVRGTGTGVVIARFNDNNSTGCTLATGGTISCSSDIRLKKNVEDTNYGLNQILNLRPVEYNWKTSADGTQKSLGFIAQEVQQVIPNLVTTDGNGYESLNTIGLIPVLTKSVQEINQKLEKSISDINVALGSVKDNVNGQNRISSLESSAINLNSSTASSSAQLNNLNTIVSNLSGNLKAITDSGSFEGDAITFRKPVSLEGSVAIGNATSANIKSTASLLVQAGTDGTGSSTNINLMPSNGGAVIVSNSDLKISSTKELVFNAEDKDGTTSFAYNKDGGYLSAKVGGKETARFKNNGDVDINGAINNNAFDLAEAYPTLDTSLEAGDVVTLDTNYNLSASDSASPAYNITKSSISSDDKVVGVVSTRPGMVLGGGSFRKEYCEEVKKGNSSNVINNVSKSGTDTSSTNNSVAGALTSADYVRSCRAVKEVPVALSGRVVVKVSAANAEIRTGDYLTSSSIPGFAEKATKAGMVIGKALEDYPKKGLGADQPNKIMVLVNVSWYDPQSTSLAQNSSDKSQMSNQIQNPNSQIINQLAVTGNTSLASLTVAGNILVSANLNITDVGFGTVTGDLEIQKKGMGNVKIFNGRATFTTDGSLTLKNTLKADKVVANEIKAGKVLVATESAQVLSLNTLGNESTNSAQLNSTSATTQADATIGSGVITTGTKKINIANNQVTANSKIFVTATSQTGGQALIVTSKTAKTGFTVEIEFEFERDIRFDWWIVN